MSAFHKGDKVSRVVTEYGHVMRCRDDGRVQVRFDGGRTNLVEPYDLTLVERADDPTQSLPGEVRAYEGQPTVCYGRDFWVFFRADGGAGYGIYRDAQVVGSPVIGVVPGTPAAEAAIDDLELHDDGSDEYARAVAESQQAPRPPFPFEVRRWVEEGARVECFSGVDPTLIVHEGRAIGWTEAPTVRVQKDDGQIISWVVGITRLARSHVEALSDWERELVEVQNFWSHSHGAVTKVLPLGEDCPDCGAREAVRQ